MVTFPNAKINIGLNILSKRGDGYHNLQTVFHPIQLKDALEIIDAPEQAQQLSFSSTGLMINGNDQDNLCIKAYHLLKKDFPEITSVKIHLHKAIPMGAGMGGGSANAAFMLIGLNKKFKLHLSKEQLMSYALLLGSDCPFFIFNETCFATGRGEIMDPIEVDLSPFKILIVNPGIHVNTRMAFSEINIGENNADLKQLIQQPIGLWKDTIFNDFENPAFAQYSEIALIKDLLYKNGALYAAMSGSGSTVYGIFDGENQPSIGFPAHYFCQWV
ncbi:MAG: 4-(cytidine 5'-diphospho)-2-C-methyl-D-erythritol kinase [Rhizobacter sp.]|nr:4-(cytidine 5'-diphospho)-2-C-methyl-D-erythritol kinase [Ferruginibacter sp.]